MHDQDDTGLAPAAQGSPLAGIRARRKAIAEKLTKDLTVPRWDEDGGNEIFVRFRPLEATEITTASKRASKSKDPRVSVAVHAGLLAEACRGVYEVVDGVAVSIDPDDRDGTPPRFDERLGELLGVDNPTRVADVVAALYFTDGDMLATSGRLTEWSGFAAGDIDSEHSGN